MADILFSELRHARGHVGPHGAALGEHGLDPLGAQLGADAIEVRRHPALVAEIHFADIREILAAQALGSAAPVAVVAGVAIHDRHRADDLLLGCERFGESALRAELRENDDTLAVADLETRHPGARLCAQAAGWLAAI